VDPESVDAIGSTFRHTPTPDDVPRQRTPIPDGPLVLSDDPDGEKWNVSPSDIAPVDDDWRMGSPGVLLSNSVSYSLMPRVLEAPSCFLIDPLWKGIHGKHIRVGLGPTFGGGNRIGYTKIPLQFDNPLRPSQVSMYWTDNKSKWQRGSLSLRDLAPARPTKKNVFVVVLDGELKGQVLR